MSTVYNLKPSHLINLFDKWVTVLKCSLIKILNKYSLSRGNEWCNKKNIEWPLMLICKVNDKTVFREFNIQKAEITDNKSHHPTDEEAQPKSAKENVQQEALFPTIW